VCVECFNFKAQGSKPQTGPICVRQKGAYPPHPPVIRVRDRVPSWAENPSLRLPRRCVSIVYLKVTEPSPKSRSRRSRATHWHGPWALAGSESHARAVSSGSLVTAPDQTPATRLRLTPHPLVTSQRSVLGSNLGGVGPDRGLRGGGRRGWCKEWARSGQDHPIFSYH
jgi:hypothetical protein